MNFLSHLATLSCACFLTIGGLVLWRDRRATANRLFALCCLCFALWNGGLAFFASAESRNEAWFWHHAMTIAWALPAALLLHLFLRLTGARTKASPLKWVLAATYAAAALFATAGALGWLVADEVVRNGSWWSYVPSNRPLVLVHTAYCLVCAVTGLVVLRHWARRKGQSIETRQARVVFWAGVVALSLATLTNRILPALGIGGIPPLTSVFMLVWAFGFLCAAVRYRLMSRTQVMAAQNIIETVPDALLLVSPRGLVEAVNGAAQALFGVDEASLLERPLDDLLPADTAAAYRARRNRHSDETPNRFEAHVVSNESGRIPVDISASEVVDRDGCWLGTVLLLRDISEQKKTRAQLRHLATHDALTRLPNRLLLRDRLRQALASARRADRGVGVFLLDLDRFKQINDTLGHSQGDRLLKQVSDRLKEVVRNEDTVARMGGDEFVVIGHSLHARDEAAVVAGRILRALDEPFEIAGRRLKVGTSIGISTFPEDGENVDLLIRNADLAMYAAKTTGRGRFAFFEPRLREAVQRDVTMEAEIRDAIARNEFCLYYQPICRIPDNEVVAMESLIRWNHPVRGLVGPGDFLPVAESTDLIVPLGRWVIRESCRQYTEWRRAGFSDTCVSVNLSPRQLLDPHLVETIDEALRAAEMPGRMLQVEITESGAMQSPAKSAHLLTELSRRGVRIALDDFGAGYSSFFRLRILPIQTVKIDRMFIANIEKSQDDRTLISAIIAMARSMGLGVVAEGVETTGQLEILARPQHSGDGVGRCDLIQGFLVSRPLPARGSLHFLRHKWSPETPASFQAPTRSYNAAARSTMGQ